MPRMSGARIVASNCMGGGVSKNAEVCCSKVRLAHPPLESGGGQHRKDAGSGTIHKVSGREQGQDGGGCGY